MLEILNKNLRLNNKGATLVTILVAVGIIAVTVTAINSGVLSAMKVKSRINNDFNISEYRGQIIASLANAGSLSQTIAANPAMSCEKNKTDCSAFKNTDTPITVLAADGTKLTDPNNAAFGFTHFGAVCNSFSSTSGNDSCPFKFEISWRPICPTVGPCTNPQNRFRGTLTAKGVKADYSQLKITKFNFLIYPAKYDNTMESNCNAIGGSFNSGNGSCTLPLAGMCPNGQIVMGVDATSNQKICGYLFSGVCPSGYKISNVNSSGGMTCVPISYCPTSTKFSTWDPWVANASGDGGDGGDGCDGADGCDGS